MRILEDLGSKFLQNFYGKKQLKITELNQIIDRKALLFICSRLSKTSGDLRIAFQVLNKALTERLEQYRTNKEAKLPITISEVTTCYDSLFESKLVGILKKLPRTHSLVVKSLHHAFSSKEHVQSVPELTAVATASAFAVAAVSAKRKAAGNLQRPP